MRYRMRGLSAAEELQLDGRAQEAFVYRKDICGTISEEEERCLWAVAGNAALLSLALNRGRKRAFEDARQVLEGMGLSRIAELAAQYQNRYEGGSEEN